MREIGPAAPADPGEVFYTIRPEDAGKAVIDTEAGPVRVGEFLGIVLPGDAGRRLYRRRVGGSYLWQAENHAQRSDRENRKRGNQ